MKRGSGRALAVVLGIVLLCLVAVGAGYHAGRYGVGGEYLERTAAEVRAPEPIAVTPRASRAGEGEPVATIVPLRPPPIDSLLDPEAAEGEGSAESGEGESPQDWTIQLGSFADKANADLLAEDLKQNRVGVSRSSVDREGRTLHRVRTGSYTSRAQAEAAAEDLRRRGYNAVIVPKE